MWVMYIIIHARLFHTVLEGVVKTSCARGRPKRKYIDLIVDDQSCPNNRDFTQLKKIANDDASWKTVANQF